MGRTLKAALTIPLLWAGCGSGSQDDSVGPQFPPGTVPVSEIPKDPAARLDDFPPRPKPDSRNIKLRDLYIDGDRIDPRKVQVWRPDREYEIVAVFDPIRPRGLDAGFQPPTAPPDLKGLRFLRSVTPTDQFWDTRFDLSAPPEESRYPVTPHFYVTAVDLVAERGPDGTVALRKTWDRPVLPVVDAWMWTRNTTERSSVVAGTRFRSPSEPALYVAYVSDSGQTWAMREVPESFRDSEPGRYRMIFDLRIRVVGEE